MANASLGQGFRASKGQQRSGRNLPGVVAACELEMDLVDV